MLSALQLHWFWTEQFYICHITLPCICTPWKLNQSVTKWKVWFYVNFLLHPTPDNSVLSHKTHCVYMFYRQSHLSSSITAHHTNAVSEGRKNQGIAIQMIVWEVKRSCIIRSIHQNDGVVITGITCFPFPTLPTVISVDMSNRNMVYLEWKLSSWRWNKIRVKVRVGLGLR